MPRRFLPARRATARHKAARLSIQTLEARDVPDAFQPGNIVVYRVGDGSALTAGAAAPVFMDEYIVSGPQAGTRRQQVALPVTDSGTQQMLTASATANAAEAFLTRSADGAYLIVTGYDAAVGTASVASSSTATIARTIGRVGADGSVDTSTTTTSFNASSIRSAASGDGSGFWSVGNNTGVVYTPFGGSGPGTVVSNTITGAYRTIGIADGQLYVSANVTGFRLAQIGTGLPTTAGQTAVALPGIDPASGSPYGFFFADLDAGVAGVDTLYVANDDAQAIKKYSLVSGSWVQNGVSIGTDQDYRGFTGIVTGNTVTLFATKKGNEIESLVDSSGYNAPINGTLALFASAGTNTGFRGLAASPVFNAAPVNSVQDQTTNEDVGISLAGLSVADPDAGTANIQVKFSLAAGTGSIHVFDNVSGGVTAGQISGNDSTSVTMTAPLAAIKKTIENTPFGSGIAYFPAADLNGPVTITMTSNDLGNTGFGGAKTDTDNFTVTVFAVNDAPVNTVQDQGTNEDVGTTLAGLSVGDMDAGTANIQVKFSIPAGTGSIHIYDNITGGVTAAQVSGNDSTSVTMTAPLAAIKTTIETFGSGIAYFPADDMNGSVTVTMTSDDLGNTGSGGPKSDTDTFTITVNPVNDAPVVSGALFHINEGTANGTAVGTVTATDVENHALTFTFTGGNTGGAFAIDPATGQITVADSAAVTGGTFTLAVTATDNGSPSAAGSADVTVVVNARPTLTGFIGDRPVFEDADPIVIDLGPVFADAEDPDTALTYSISGNSDPSLFSSIIFAGTTLTLTLTPNANGQSAVTVRATDTGGLFVGNAFLVRAMPVNDAPTFDAIGTVTVNEGNPSATVDLTGIAAGPADESGEAVTITATSSDPGLVPDPVVNYTGGPTGTLTLTPAAGATGVATITVTATDNGGTANGGVNTSTRTFTFRVNAAPTTSGLPDWEILEDSGAVSVNLFNAFEDAEDGDALFFNLESNTNPALFTSTPSFLGNSLNFTPGPHAFGTGSLTVRATDTKGLFVDASFVVTLTAVNDAPTLTAIGDVTIAEDAAGQTVDLAGISVGPVNEAAQTLTVTATSDNPGLVPNPTVDFAGGVTGALHFTPVADGNGSAVITVTVTDDGGTANGGANTVVRTFTVTVGSQDDRPTLKTAGTPMLPPAPVFGKVLSNGGLVADLTENVTDADAGALKGVAIVGADTAKGRWQYNLSGDPVTWQNFPTDLSPANALLLADDGNTRVRFVPKPKFNGFASLMFAAWDQSNGAAEGTRDDSTAATDIAYSTTTDRGWVAVGRTIPKVDADGRTVIPAIREDSRLPRVVTVKAILGLAKLEAAPKTNLGLALTGASTATGTWQFRLAGTTAWQNVGPVSDAAALLLRPTDVLRFTPAPNADADATLTFKVWDQTGGTAGLPLVPATGPAFGTDPGGAVLDIKAVNDAPILDLSKAAVLNPVDAGGTTNAATLGSLMATTDVEGAAVGVAVFQASGPGQWHYRPAGGVDTVLPRVSALRALLLAADTEVWFVADPLAPAATAKLSFRAWDRSNLKPVGGFAAIAGSAFSKQAEVLTVAVGNTAPDLDTSALVVLPPVNAGATGGTGALIRTLLGTLIQDPDPNALRGVALTTADNTNGRWEYNLGLKWIAVGTVSPTAALLLPETARLRFIPAAGVTGGTATINYKAWDRTAGITGDRIDTASGLDSFSALTETATVTVIPA